MGETAETILNEAIAGEFGRFSETTDLLIEATQSTNRQWRNVAHRLVSRIQEVQESLEALEAELRELRKRNAELEAGDS